MHSLIRQSLWRHHGSTPVIINTARRCFSKLLSPDERSNLTSHLTKEGSPSAWTNDDSGRDAIKKTFLFTDFEQAFRWMNQVAVVAEKMNHHPEWYNCYNLVEVTLTTHSCGGVSELDVQMAKQMDEFQEQILPSGNP